MAGWADEVASHPARARAQEALTHLQQVRERLQDTDSVAEWDRLNVLVGAADSQLRTADPHLIGPNMLSLLDGALNQVVSALQALLAQPQDQPANLAGSLAPGHTLAEALATWPPLTSEEAASEARAAIGGLRDATQTALASMEERVQAAGMQADALRQKLGESSVQSEQSLQALQTQVGELSSTITQEKARLDEALRANQVTFEQDQTQRRTDYTEKVQAAEAAFSTARETIETQAKAEAEASSKAALDHVAALEELRGRAREIVGVIGRTGMSGGYQQDADKEEAAADRYRRFTIGFAAAALAVLAVAAFGATFQDADTPELVSRALLSAAFGGIAAYTARQSAHHRGNARAARTLELKLASIGAYLEPLDPQRQKEVLEAFAYLLFTTPTSALTAEDGVGVGPTNVQALLETLLKLRSQ